MRGSLSRYGEDLAPVVGVVAERDRVDRPAASSSSAIGGVMPSPPAAFSPLTTTKVGLELLAQRGSRPSSVRRPSPPTTSPTKRMLGIAAS
jgi:hypothetical protein